MEAADGSDATEVPTINTTNEAAAADVSGQPDGSVVVKTEVCFIIIFDLFYANGS